MEPRDVDAFAMSTSAMETPATFPYKPLDTGKSEIRLLKFPAKDSDNFELITLSLDDHPEYAALSYLWGDPKDQEVITVQGHEVGVTKNLAAALSRLRRGRSSLETDYLWADAICIDQTNLDERSQQVQLMGRIFSSALVVYSWVGPKDYTLAFDALATLARRLRENVRDRTDDDLLSDSVIFQLDWLRQDRHFCDPQDQPESPHRGNPWQAIASLASEKYWKRVWVFQEVTLARRLLLLSSGDMMLGWGEVQLATESFGELAFEIWDREQSKPDFISPHVWESIQEFHQWHSFESIVLGKYHLKAPLQDRTEYFRWILSDRACALEATNPKDYIYGLLGITMIPISPNYGPEKSLSELFIEYITGWLDVICRSNEGSMMPLSFLSVAGVADYGPSDLPSWVPNYPGNARLIQPHAFLTFPDYKKEFPGNHTRNPYVFKDTQSLFVWGKKMGPVGIITEELDCSRLQDFYLFIKSFVSRHAHYVSGVPSFQAICKLLVGGMKTRADTRRAVMTALCIAFLAADFDVADPETTQELPWHDDWETRLYDFAFPGIDMQELGFGSTPRQDTSLWGTEERNYLLQYLDGALKEWNYFELESGHLGTAPLGTKKGDVLCFLEGYILPVLLRKTEGDHYVFVGTARVLDLDIRSPFLNLRSEGQWLELR